MSPLAPPPAPAGSLRPWILTACFAVAAILAGIGYWTVREKSLVRERLIELQQVEIAALQTALETESMVSAGTLQQLRPIGAGRSISAWALLRLPADNGGHESIVACWSDELAAGFLVLPALRSAPPFADLQVFVASEGHAGLEPLPLIPGKSAHLIGFTQPAGNPSPTRLIIQFSDHGPGPAPLRLEADWQR